MQLASLSLPIANTYIQQIPATQSLSPSILAHSSLIPRTQCFHVRLYCSALKTGPNGGRMGSQDAAAPDLVRKPLISTSPLYSDGAPAQEPRFLADDEVGGGGGGGNRAQSFEDSIDEREKWVDWEDRILEDTVPLVGFVRMILHSGKYTPGERLSPEHQKTILERVLPYHPECDMKIGCGVDYITIGYHYEFEESRCLYIVRKDGEKVDFSYWKCIKGLIRQNYPLYAESFILRHFRRRRRNE